jgi:ketosteroid isomerase-like protein
MSTTHHTTGSAVVRAFVGAINARDFATLKAMMAPDVEYHLLPASLGMPAAVGIEAAAGGLEQVCKFVPDFSVRAAPPSTIVP